MKKSTCAICGRSVESGVELFSVTSPSRFYFSVCRADLGRVNTLNPQREQDEILCVRATFGDAVDGRTAHAALLGEFPQNAAVKLFKASNVRNGHDVTFSILVPTDRRCDAAKSLNQFCKDWNAEITTITGTRFEFPVDCKTTDELRVRQKWCRDHRDTVKYPALRK